MTPADLDAIRARVMCGTSGTALVNPAELYNDRFALLAEVDRLRKALKEAEYDLLFHDEEHPNSSVNAHNARIRAALRDDAH